MKLHLRSFGNGPRNAVALHCSLAQGAAWAGVASALPHLTILAPDLTGHGRSPDWDGVTDYHSQTTRDVLDVIEGPCDLIGHSFGATLALRIALERPDLIRTLTLVEPVLFAAARAAAAPEFAVYRGEMAAFSAHVQAGDMRAAAAAFQDVWGGGTPLSALPPHLQDYIVARIGLIVAAHPALEGDSAGLLAHGRLDSLDVPVLLVEGARSPSVIGAIQTELARRLARARRVVIQGAGHMAPITHAAEVAAAVGELMLSP